MHTRAIQQFLVAAAFVATAHLAPAQTVTLDFDGAPAGPLPWSEQGFTFTEGGSGAFSGVGIGELGQVAFAAGPGEGALSSVQLVRDDGGTFDAVSLDVVAIIIDSGIGCAQSQVLVSSSRGAVSLFEPGTVLLDWTGITELTVEVLATAVFDPYGSPVCEALLSSDNYVVNTPEPECLLVIGDGPGDATFFEIDYTARLGPLFAIWVVVVCLTVVVGLIGSRDLLSRAPLPILREAPE